MNKAMDLFAIHRPYCFDLLIGLNFKSMQYEERLFHWWLSSHEMHVKPTSLERQIGRTTTTCI